MLGIGSGEHHVGDGFFFSSRRRHTRLQGDWSSDVCSSDLDHIRGLKIAGRNGRQVALGELVRVEKSIEDKSIYHKNLMPVTYVTADIAGEIESPVYAVLKLGP